MLAVQRKGRSFKWTQVRSADDSGNPFPLYFMCEDQATGPKSQLENSLRAMVTCHLFLNQIKINFNFILIEGMSESFR